EDVGHDQVTVFVGVDAVLGAGQGIGLAVLGLGLGHDFGHGVVDVGEDDAFACGDLTGNVAFLGKDGVVLRGALDAAPERLRVDYAGRAQNDESHAVLL